VWTTAKVAGYSPYSWVGTNWRRKRPEAEQLPDSLKFPILFIDLRETKRARRRETIRDRIRRDDHELQRLKRGVFSYHVDALLGRHFPSADSEERRYLKEHILKQLDYGIGYDDEHYEHSLQKFLQAGIDGVRLQRRAERRVRIRRAIWRSFVVAALQTARILGVLYIYSRMHTTEASLLLSGLILVYVQLAHSLQVTDYRAQLEDLANRARFIELRKAVGVLGLVPEEQALETESKQADQAVLPRSIQFFGNDILVFIALWRLFIS
jgi:hypothetical protein